jgi:plastocyanin
MAQTHAVTIKVVSGRMAFDPATKAITRGDTVAWTNTMSMEHTVTSDDGSSFDSKEIEPGKTFSYTFNDAGSFPYHCEIHGFMKGTITVA